MRVSTLLATGVAATALAALLVFAGCETAPAPAAVPPKFEYSEPE